MKTDILENLMHLLIVLPLILLTLKNKNKESLKIVLVFSLFVIAHNILLYLPLEYKELRLFNERWNWTGKIFSIIGSIAFVLFYRKFELKDYYLTFAQNKSFLKKGTIIIFSLFLIVSVLAIVFHKPLAWSTETIMYQLTMPGFGEEIAYRGIMLGLLVQILKPSKQYIPHMAILITALLFGMAHGLKLNDSYELSFRSFAFFNTLILGILWGWLTMRSNSIALATVSHNLGNISNFLIRMLKF